MPRPVPLSCYNPGSRALAQKAEIATFLSLAKLERQLRRVVTLVTCQGECPFLDRLRAKVFLPELLMRVQIRWFFPLSYYAGSGK